MPRAVTRDSYTPAPVGAVGFDEEADAIKRQRARVESLLSSKQAEGLPGWKGAAAQTILAIARGYNDKTLGDKEQDLAARRAEAAQEWIKRMPRPTPGVDEVNPSESPPELGMYGGGPPMPTNYKEQMQQPMADGNDTGGILPQRPTFEHTPELPMLPVSMRDAAQWSQEGAGFSPYHAALAAKVTEQAMTMPEKIAEAKRIRDEKAAEKAEAARIRAQELEYKRIEKEQAAEKAAADKEAQRARDAADRYERDRANAADREALRAIVVGGKEGAAEKKGKTDADQKEITSHIVKYGEAIKKEKLPSIETSLSDVEKQVDAVRAKNNGQLPGVGYLANLPGTSGLLDDDVKKMRGAIAEMRNAITVSRAGLSQTAAEMRNVLEELGLKWWSPEEDFINALPRLRTTLEARKENLRSTYRPEAVEEYHRRIGQRNASINAPPGAAGATGWGKAEVVK